jgi:membrane associated rhomboid family serine protease
MMSLEKVRAQVERFGKALTWPFVALIIGGGLIFAAIVFWAPADSRELLLGANGLLATIAGYVLRSPRDCDCDK